jgi:protocatechuate 3,4-dioxygenase beta subunit
MTQPAHDDHDRGLQHDLLTIAARLHARRRVLGMVLGGGAAALIAGCGGGGSSTSTASTSTSGTSAGGTTTGGTTTGGSGSGTCLADATETNGPYPSDGSNTANGVLSNSLLTSGIVRSDIRSSFGGMSGTAGGVPLTLNITLQNTNSSCAAYPNAAIYIWHCTANGLYSLYSAGATAENYLRGVQVTGSNGQLSFTTVFPGCYAGRYPHIHFEVFTTLGQATGGSQARLISQFAMPLAACNDVYANGGALYSASAGNLAAAPIGSDNVFGDNSAAQIALMTPSATGSAAAGYTANVVVGVAF